MRQGLGREQMLDQGGERRARRMRGFGWSRAMDDGDGVGTGELYVGVSVNNGSLVGWWKGEYRRSAVVVVSELAGMRERAS